MDERFIAQSNCYWRSEVFSADYSFVAQKHTSISNKHFRTRETLIIRQEIRETLIIRQETRETLIIRQETRETLIIRQETRETLIIRQETRETLIIRQETRETLQNVIQLPRSK
jgi:hypothetical protein